MSYVVGVDLGGTCTDSVVLTEDGRLSIGKCLTTSPTYVSGILESLSRAAADLGLCLRELLAETALFLHSTTVAENAIVDGTLAGAAMITTRGFEDTLVIARGGYGRWVGLSDPERHDVVRTDKPEPLIPRRLCVGIAERTDRWGEVLAAPSERQLAEVLDRLDLRGLDSLAVCLVWSPANPANEKAVAAFLRERCPGLFVTASHEISPVLGEYERMSTTALNARLGPIVHGHLDSLAQELNRHGFSGSMLVMQSYGGLLPLAEARERPVGVIESGPAGGLLASKTIAAQIGASTLVSTDMGGTTFKVGVVRDGVVEYQPNSTVFRHPYALPKLDIVSLGLAGGSIVSVDPVSGVPRVGPRSAGACPGPVCYGRGGTEPTLTDVDAILGYLNPDYFLGGTVALDIASATRIFGERVARPLGMEVEEAAGAIYRLANNLLYDLLHKVTVERGLDPRRCVLLACGGTAGMHAATYGRQLGVRAIVVPYSAAVHGAFGLVASDVVCEEQATHPLEEPFDPRSVSTIVDGLQDTVRRRLADAGFRADEVMLSYATDVRYRRQVHSVTTPLPGAPPYSERSLTDTIATFEQLYAVRYGENSGHRQAGVNLTAFRVRGAGRLHQLALSDADGLTRERGPAGSGTRRAFLPMERRFASMSCHDFGLLRPGVLIEGPAIVWTPVTTVVLNPGQHARVDSAKNLVIAEAGRDWRP